MKQYSPMSNRGVNRKKKKYFNISVIDDSVHSSLYQKIVTLLSKPFLNQTAYITAITYNYAYKLECIVS